MCLHEPESRQECCEGLAVLDAPAEFRLAPLDGLLLKVFHNSRIHCLHKDRHLCEPLSDDRKDLLDIRLGQVHRQTLDDDQRRQVLLLNFTSPVLHRGHGDLRDLAALGQKLFPYCNRLGQVEVIPVGVSLHPVAARIQTTGDVHDHGTRMLGQIPPGQLIQHDGARDNAAAHRRVAVREGEVVVQLFQHFLSFFVLNCATGAALLGPGIQCLQHRFRHTGKRNFFTHNKFPTVQWLFYANSSVAQNPIGCKSNQHRHRTLSTPELVKFNFWAFSAPPDKRSHSLPGLPAEQTPCRDNAPAHF